MKTLITASQQGGQGKTLAKCQRDIDVRQRCACAAMANSDTQDVFSKMEIAQ
jgi:hypothetical protein